jgi:hypothetical protein
MAAGRRALKGPQRSNRDAGVGAEEARRCGEPIPCGGGRWEPPERAGGEYLRRESVVNVGRASGKEREPEERSRRTASSLGSFLKGRGSRRSTRRAGTIAGVRQTENTGRRSCQGGRRCPCFGRRSETESEGGGRGRLGFLGGSRSGLAWEGDKRRREWLARWWVKKVEGLTRAACSCEEDDTKRSTSPRSVKVGLQVGFFPREEKGQEKE